MTVDANYFDGWEHRIKSPTKAEVKEAQRHCYCGHILGLHFSIQTAEPGHHGDITIRYGKWRCHAMACVCEKWHWYKRLRSKIKRKIGRR